MPSESTVFADRYEGFCGRCCIGSVESEFGEVGEITCVRRDVRLGVA